MLDIKKLVLEAEQRCRPYIWETPLEYSHYLSQLVGGKVWLKLDMVQKTTSFKIRGATSKIMSLTNEELEKGVVTASTGNYAFAVAEATRMRGFQATSFVAHNISPSRLDLMHEHGLNVVVAGEEAGESERLARVHAAEQGMVYVSPYNDPLVVAGQGTCGLEISRQLPDVEAVVIAVGGGGLIGGSGGWLKSFNEAIEVIGVSPRSSPVMYESLEAGEIVDLDILPTLADTCAGGVDHDTITLDLCQRYVDHFALAEEAEIEDAIRLLFEQHRLIVEGSAALGVAAMVKDPERFRNKNTVLVVCGRNISIQRFKNIINRDYNKEIGLNLGAEK